MSARDRARKKPSPLGVVAGAQGPLPTPEPSTGLYDTKALSLNQMIRDGKFDAHLKKYAKTSHVPRQEEEEKRPDGNKKKKNKKRKREERGE